MGYGLNGWAEKFSCFILSATQKKDNKNLHD